MINLSKCEDPECICNELRSFAPIVRTCGCGCDRDHCFFCGEEFDATPTKRDPLKGSITHSTDCLWLKLQD